jgi:IS30 family transposase
MPIFLLMPISILFIEIRSHRSLEKGQLLGNFSHKQLTHALECDVFFADPYCSWQRGLNENNN